MTKPHKPSRNAYMDAHEKAERELLRAAARPAHRPRRDPKAARIRWSCRLHPDTIQLLDAEAERTNQSAGQVIDLLALTHLGARKGK